MSVELISVPLCLVGDLAVMDSPVSQIPTQPTGVTKELWSVMLNTRQTWCHLKLVVKVTPKNKTKNS